MSKRIRNGKYVGRLCVICHKGCGPHLVVSADEDKELLRRFGTIKDEPRRGVVWHVCATCSTFAIDINSRIEMFCLMVATGLFAVVERLYPDVVAKHQGDVHRLLDHKQSASFAGSKHGSADFRLDRMTLFIAGPLAANYCDDKLNLFFCILFLRACCNHSDAAQKFMATWRKDVGNYLTLANYNADNAVAILDSIWKPEYNSKGFGQSFFVGILWWWWVVVVVMVVVLVVVVGGGGGCSMGGPRRPKGTQWTPTGGQGSPNHPRN